MSIKFQAGVSTMVRWYASKAQLSTSKRVRYLFPGCTPLLVCILDIHARWKLNIQYPAGSIQSSQISFSRARPAVPDFSDGRWSLLSSVRGLCSAGRGATINRPEGSSNTSSSRQDREYLREEQRRLAGRIAGRMPSPFLTWVPARRAPGHRYLLACQTRQTPISGYPVLVSRRGRGDGV
jgi:hypothetical protein